MVARCDARVVLLAALALSACAHPPPQSQFPTADVAIARMRDTAKCSRGVRGESKIDYFGEQGRIRASALFVASRPERLRIDVFSPFGATLSTLTTDGRRFALLDLMSKQFFAGPADECNLTRFLRVPVPPFALVALLDGEAPVLVHRPEQASIEWSSGAYSIHIQSLNGASQEIRLEPVPKDFDLPYQKQRVRVVEVRVEQQGVELYRADLGDFEVAHTAAPRVDPDGIDPDVPPSGPSCSADLPHRIHIRSEASAQDVLLTQKELFHNPPIQPGLFVQKAPGGVQVRAASCR